MKPMKIVCKLMQINFARMPKMYSDFILGANSQIFRGDFIKKIYNEATSEIKKKKPKKPVKIVQQ